MSTIMSSGSSDPTSQEIFSKLKVICVPLLGASKLSPSSLSAISKLLTELIAILRAIESPQLTPSLISYTFFPLSTILQRNASSEIPDQVLEKILCALSLLCDAWWWDCELKTWEQIFMLCGAIIGGIEGKGKGKDRDDETKEAATQCLFTLLRERSGEEALARFLPAGEAAIRLDVFRENARSSKFLPILGQTLDSVLSTTESRRISLQRVSLQLLSLFVDVYAPEDFIPAVLPGVMSKMTRVCIGTSSSKGWINGEIVALTLNVMQLVIVKAIGDNICIREGALHHVVDLEDLANPPEERNAGSSTASPRPYTVQRTSSWLRGTSSQLHIAINTLSPLVSHPTPSALHSLSKFSAAVLRDTPLTLPQSQPLLLSFLLSLSNSIFSSVSSEARRFLSELLTAPSSAQSLLQTMMRIMGDNLASLPRLLSSEADAKVEHVAGLIQAVCRLAISEEDLSKPLSAISKGIGKLLGPTGGIEKWGWSLLSVLEFVEPSVTLTHTSSGQLSLESNPDAPQWVPFPELTFKHVSSNSTREALEKMLQSLGRAGGDSCLFAVEWFADVGRTGTSPVSVAAMWCACRLLEGIADVSLSSGGSEDWERKRGSKRLQALARTLSRSVAELWDKSDFDAAPELTNEKSKDEDNPLLNVQHQKGLVPLHETLKIIHPLRSKPKGSTSHPMLHRALCLQMISITAGIVQARFTSQFIYVLYPILHSLVSSMSYLSSTALATLHFITVVTSHASPANLLLSNFDYALDSVSRRLTRRWLDVDATKVLIVMIRLVGSDIVDRANDVVEECFDRLDEFHGYQPIVESLVEVLAEVVNVIQTDVKSSESNKEPSSPPHKLEKVKNLDNFFSWLGTRHDPCHNDQDTTNYGPAPREAWGSNQDEETADKDDDMKEPNGDTEAPETPIQVLTKQIVSRSIYFLTHRSPIIRARILTLLSSSAVVLSEPALLPSIHSAWPFIINRLGDTETFVVAAAAGLLESLSTRVGSFMFRRIWDDVWPRFSIILGKLESADSKGALQVRAGHGGIDTQSAYTHSHRLYRSIMKTMTAALNGVGLHDPSVWQVMLVFRRFLCQPVNEELQSCARELYLAAGKGNPDVVWLALSSTSEKNYPIMGFMWENRWDINKNKGIILQCLDS